MLLAPGWPQLRSRLPFGPRSQASLQKAQGPGVRLHGLAWCLWLGDQRARGGCGPASSGLVEDTMYQRRQWHPTPVLLPGKSHGRRSLVGCSPWSLSLFTFLHWRRKWQPTPVFLPGESQGRWGLVGCRLWGRREGAQGASRVAPGKSGPHEMARGSSSLLSSHGSVIGPQDGLKKDSRGLSRVTA